MSVFHCWTEREREGERREGSKRARLEGMEGGRVAGKERKGRKKMGREERRGERESSLQIRL